MNLRTMDVLRKLSVGLRHGSSNTNGENGQDPEQEEEEPPDLEVVRESRSDDDAEESDDDDIDDDPLSQDRSRGGKGKGKSLKSESKAKKARQQELEPAAIDAVTIQDCSYNPVPWSKRQKPTSANTADMLLARRQGFNSRRRMSAALGGAYIPNCAARPLGIFTEKVYCGRFSTSGDVLVTASQDAVINLYDSQSVYQWSAKPPDPEVDHHEEMQDDIVFRQGPFYRRRFSYSQRATNPKSQQAWQGAPKPIKTIQCQQDTGWSVVSTDFSPDEKWLAYSSWSRIVHLCNTRGGYELHEELEFSPKPTRRFCLFSIQFSPTNTHILGGGSDNCVYLYSLERKERVARIPAHDQDVNAVAFVDQSSQVVLSGGDDCVIKIWDLRSPEAAVGGLCGHQAGVTCITAKGDGHHFISNGKDQTLKLWDIRKMLHPKEKRMVDAAVVPTWSNQCCKANRRACHRRPGHSSQSRRAADASVKTFHGHKVLQTLIRCYFSPQHTTGQRFVMSGSSDGRVCVWDILTGEMVRSLSWHRDTTRDVSWHPFLPLVASFSWDHSVGLWGYSAAAPDVAGAKCDEERSRGCELPSVL